MDFFNNIETNGQEIQLDFLAIWFNFVIHYRWFLCVFVLMFKDIIRKALSLTNCGLVCGIIEVRMIVNWNFKKKLEIWRVAQACVFSEESPISKSGHEGRVTVRYVCRPMWGELMEQPGISGVCWNEC